jgi:hypothetical protein
MNEFCHVPSYFICLRKARLVLDTSTTKARLQTKTRQHHSDERPMKDSAGKASF